MTTQLANTPLAMLPWEELTQWALDERDAMVERAIVFMRDGKRVYLDGTDKKVDMDPVLDRTHEILCIVHTHPPRVSASAALSPPDIGFAWAHNVPVVAARARDEHTVEWCGIWYPSQIFHVGNTLFDTLIYTAPNVRHTLWPYFHAPTPDELCDYLHSIGVSNIGAWTTFATPQRDTEASAAA